MTHRITRVTRYEIKGLFWRQGQADYNYNKFLTWSEYVGRNKQTPLATKNLLEDTDGLLRPPSKGGAKSKGTKQPISVLSGAVAGCDRFLLTSASLGDVIAFEGTLSGGVASRAMTRAAKWKGNATATSSRPGTPTKAA